MDFCRNVTVSGEYHKQQEQAPPASTLDDLFSAQDTEVDVSLEWLSVFVEDCLSSTGNCLPLPSQNLHQTSTNHATTPPPPPTKPTFQQQQQKPQQNPSSPSFKKFPVPVKARSKRNRVIITNAKNRRFNPLLTSWSYNSHLNLHSSDPPLLHQTHWLADSELIISPQKQEIEVNFVTRFEDEQEINAAAGLGLMSSSNGNDKDKDKDNDSSTGQQQQQQPRRCTHCHSQRTPQWRAGPLGPKTLCNACGVRYKSGRLLPEYRPAKSPTFSTYLHSNSHKKVLEMRNMVSSTTTATTTSTTTSTSTSTSTSPTPSTSIPLIPSHNE